MVARLVILLRHASWSRAAVQLACDGVSDVGQLLLLLFKVFAGSGGRVLVEPFGGFLDCFEELVERLLAFPPVVRMIEWLAYCFFVFLVDLSTKSLLVIDLVLQAECVIL